MQYSSGNIEQRSDLAFIPLTTKFLIFCAY